MEKEKTLKLTQGAEILEIVSEKDLKKDRLVVKSNALIKSGCHLSLSEWRLVEKLISLIKKYDQDFKTYQINVKDFANALGLSQNNKSIYKHIDEAAEGLMSEIITIKKEKTIIKMAWLSFVEYGDGVIKMRFDKALKPYLLAIGKNFTSYYIYQAQKYFFKHSYSYQFYDLMRSYKNIAYIKIDLKEIKEILGIKSQYKQISEFKRYVLMPSQKEINKFSDIYFSFEPIKTGRKITAFKFISNEKKKQKLLKPAKQNE